ncbi:protein mahjong isoform X2 [Planococcus citri]|uniref:protein mahjong isoform X2 n=1 Tax=Planococcus citri TaxID=170843 RepID=UPI0031F9DC57
MDLQTETDISAILRQWDEDQATSMYDPVPLLTRLAELVEAEAENYQKIDPDPFDERHPSRADPNCSFGQMLKVLFRKDTFMNKLVNDYLRENYWTRQGVNKRDIRPLNTVACRLMIDIMPGLETSVVFETPTNDALVQRLYCWAERGGDPLQTYATGLIAAAMEVQDIANMTRELNNKLVPLMLDRLHALHKQACVEKMQQEVPSTTTSPSINFARPFAHLAKDKENSDTHCNNHDSKINNGFSNSLSQQDHGSSDQVINGYLNENESDYTESLKRRRSTDYSGMTSPIYSKKPSPYHSDFSNSSWAEMETLIIGNVQIHPPTLATKQMFILKYLTPMGEYQEFLSHIVEKNALSLILQIINRKNWQNARLTFEALRYLAAILCHKKFAIEFVNMQGLQKLLEVPRIGISATGVSICFFYLAHCEDSMEKICLLPSHVISKLIKYGLWLLECSHDSGRCHVTMFFGLSFQFRVILKEFDAADGLRKLVNVLSTLPILASEDTRRNEDEECSVRQIVRQVCAALKRYFEAHLFLKTENTRRAFMRDTISPDTKGQNLILPSYKSGKSTPEVVRGEINFLLEYLNFKARWQPVNEFMDLGGITLMLKIIAFTYDWNYSGRVETVRSALDVINICSVLPTVQLQLCDVIQLPEDTNTLGITIILGAAEGEIVTDPEVQKAALNVIITCACAPVTRDVSSVSSFSSSSARKKWPRVQSGEEIVQKVWDCIRTSNGIMVLMTLMTIKTPITDADAIRALACQALAGLARSETVRQIISKLPLFTTGQLQSLMNDPILQDRRQEHVIFQKYAVELMEKVSGKSKATGSQLEASLANMHKANVVAQTKIMYNNRQLFQIIHQHLLKHGLNETANVLQKEANLPPIKTPIPVPNLSPFAYKMSKARLNNASDPKHMKPVLPNQNCTDVSPSVASRVSNAPFFQSPIRVNLNNRRFEQKGFQTPSPGRSLQKQMRCELVLPPPQPERNTNLDSIITEYLANQHSLCKNPMVTCPQFDLLLPHKCPDPKPKKLLYGNFTTRFSKGMHIRRLDEHLVHSRFYQVKTFRLMEDEGYFNCCEFVNDRCILAGTYHGYVKMLNLHTGIEDGSWSCHQSYISNLSINSEGSLVATSSAWRSPLSALWKIRENSLDNLYYFNDEEHFEFSNVTEDKLIGTKGVEATIYNIERCKKIMTLKPSQSNQYNKNRAVFNPTDELVLSDGVLWDVTSGKEIHKFDKLNQTLSGVFHPNGLEIISNAEVWDIRTFHLLRTVPSLDQCAVVFPKTGRTFYAVTTDREIDGDAALDTSFKTLDAYDYSSITTVDVKKPICYLACNRFDTQIALVENCGHFEDIEESSLRIYDVGRSKDDDDEAEDEDEEEDDDINSGSGSDDQQDEGPLELIDDNDDGNDDDDNDEDDDDDDDTEDEFAFYNALSGNSSSSENTSDSNDDDDI